MTSIQQKLHKLLRRAGTARSRELVAAGITRSQLSRMVAARQLLRVARGLYALPDYQTGEHGALVTVARRAPWMADCFKFRNKIGLDLALEALREARRTKKASADELARYAKVNRVTNVMRPYLEAVA